MSRPAAQVLFAEPTLKVTKRRLRVGTAHVYPLTVEAGNFVELIAHQDGVDIQVAVLDPAENGSFTVDSHNGENGPERVLVAAKETKVYRLEVSGRDKGATGLYRIWIAAKRRATARDSKEAQAEKLFHQAREALGSGDLRFSEPKLKEASRLWRETRNLERRADTLQLLGNLYRQRWQWQKSLDARLQAKSVYRQLRRFRDEGALANDIGIVYEQLSDLDAARKSFEEALASGQRYRIPSLSAVAFNNLGNLARRQSRSGEALEDLERARAIWKDSRDSREIKTLTAIGLVYADAGKLELALPEFKEALELADQRRDLQQKAIALMQMGNSLASQHPEQARRLYEQAQAILLQHADLESLAATLNGIGLVLLYQKKFQDALEPLQKALRIYELKGSPLDQARVLTNLGWTYAGLQRKDDARTAYEGALIRARGKDGWAEAGARLGLARLEEQSRNPIAARAQAEAAVRAVETLRVAVSRDLRTSFLATKQDVYDVLIEIILWQHELQPSAGFDARALIVSEQARSRGLLDDISEPRTRMPAERLLSTPKILSLPEIQRTVLDAETLLLEFHFGSKASYLWLASQSSLQVFKLPPRTKLELLIEKAHRSLARSGRREKLSETWRTVTELSRALLGPAGPWLGQKRLLISAPASLQGIPFAVLPDPDTLDSGAIAGRPLVWKHEIIKIPSASVLAALQARQSGRTPPPFRLALLADPILDLSDERLAGITVPASASLHRIEGGLGSLLGRFKRLAHAREEAEAILAETGRHDVLAAFGLDATRDLVLSGRLRNFRILHFTTHGVLQADDAELSALVFSLMDSSGKPRDGFLRAADISGLDLPADLVVLSACETGLGKKIPGEGLVGLPQAFMAAGATRLLVSLWRVDDLASAELMKRFYREYLGRGRSPAAALREAQKAMWQSRRHRAPFYWAAFELQGDWRAESPR